MSPRTYILQMGEPFIHSLLEVQLNCNILKTIFIGIELLYHLILVSVVHQSQSIIGIHRSLHFWIAFPFRSPQSTEQSSFHCFLFQFKLFVETGGKLLYNTVIFFFLPCININEPQVYMCPTHPEAPLTSLPSLFL